MNILGLLIEGPFNFKTGKLGALFKGKLLMSSFDILNCELTFNY